MWGIGHTFIFVGQKLSTIVINTWLPLLFFTPIGIFPSLFRKPTKITNHILLIIFISNFVQWILNMQNKLHLIVSYNNFLKKKKKDWYYLLCCIFLITLWASCPTKVSKILKEEIEISVIQDHNITGILILWACNKFSS